jgi:hypothetical protein
VWINIQREVKNKIGLGMWCSSKPVEIRESPAVEGPQAEIQRYLAPD